ncbi:ATPase [Novosphingopyxis baekryungensis]|uniref:ATPase n=1 Tax=Novosphingopyxis baekryungensis TaxID=279369 RepID=UPI0003B78638|nr:ATPase [Novosphingopyxis baekryungensis]
MRQIALPLDWSAAGGGELVVSKANEGAAGLIENHSYWPHGGVILTGPPRSGKTMMAEHFRTSHGGQAIDDADRMEDEALFHAWNAAKSSGQPLLLTARTPPGEWRTALPDLRSRLAAMQLVELGEPDDALLEALLRLHLTRLGTGATDETLSYIVKRIDRSYAATERFALEANARALEQGGPVGMKLARMIFDHQNELDM